MPRIRTYNRRRKRALQREINRRKRLTIVLTCTGLKAVADAAAAVAYQADRLNEALQNVAAKAQVVRHG